MNEQLPEKLEISPEELPEKIKELRRKNSLTQKELAEKLNITQQQISALEKGKSDPSLKVLGAIAAILGVVIIIGAFFGKGEKGK